MGMDFFCELRWEVHKGGGGCFFMGMGEGGLGGNGVYLQADNGQRTTDNGLQTTDNRLRTSLCDGRRVFSWELWGDL